MGLLGGILALLATQAAVAAGPYTVCTATLNSEQEREVFKRRLQPVGDFQFVELVDKDASGWGWFDRACEKGIQCDVLLISGHFAGGFFGERTSAQLPLEALEAQACSEKCAGILRRPKEIFLLGCNTLASKAPDSRSRQDYYNALIAHGTPRHHAERLTEDRYGELGLANEERMRAVFRGVPHIYGYDSIGPKGRQVGPAFDDYFRKIRDYSEHLEKAEHEGMNRFLATSLASFNFAQCDGSLKAVEVDNHKVACSIWDERLPLDQRLRNIEPILQGERFLKFIPSISDVLSAHPVESFGPKEKEAFARLKDARKGREILLSQLEKARSPYLRLQLLKLGRSFDWVDAGRARGESRKSGVELLSYPMDAQMADDLCGLAKSDAFDLRDLALSEIPKGLFSNAHGMRALSCVAPRSPEIQNRLLRELEKPYVGRSDEDPRHSMIMTLGRAGATEPQVLARLVALAQGKDLTLQRVALKALGESGTRDPGARAALVKVLEAEGFNADRAAEAIRELRMTEPEAIAGLRRIIERGNAAVAREKAIEALDTLRPGDPRDQILYARELGRNGTQSSRIAAATALLRAPSRDPEILNRLTDVLDDGDRKVRILAIRSLAKSKAALPKAIEKLQRIADTRYDSEERKYARLALSILKRELETQGK